MILKNLNELGTEVKNKIQNYDYKELILSDSFKNYFSTFLSENSNDKIEFQKFTTIITTPKDLKIIFPNQWFYIASFFYDFLNSLWLYKGITNELNFSQETIKNLRNSNIDNDTKRIIKAKLDKNEDFESYVQFLTNYDWWFGSKTIDRGDFFVSSVLNLAKVVNVSHSYLADLAYYFSKNENLKNLITQDFERLINLKDSKTIEIILEDKKLRVILINTFKYILNKFGEEEVLKGYEIKDAKIEERNYKGISLPKYFGFETVIGMFEQFQESDKLKSSGTLRFIEEEITIKNHHHCYFTSQWNENNGRGLSLINFNYFLNEISKNTLEIIKVEKTFKLIHKFDNKLNSPLKKTEQKIFYGAPGTGKSYKIDQEIQNLHPKFYERVTFHPEYDHTNFVGGYRPKSEKNEKGEDIITYQFVPQAFTNIYERAWNDIENQYYLIIEEINRGNCAEIFGDIFQLLDRNSNYTVSPSTELKEHLEKVLTNQDGINKGLRLPSNLTIYATMNTSDQSLFPMDSAFKRRWDWEYIPICYDNIPENESFGYIVIIDENIAFKWIDFLYNVNTIIKTNANLGMDKCLGNYFIKSETKEISLNDFINKAIFYLWNDVFKDEDNTDSIFEKGTSYEDFFPINSNGKNLVLKIIEQLNITIENKQ
ncbi:hypothetical protein B0A56_00010 [Flavobacterium columnare NBRC 100251 = ATCC 23463]|nr:hypothetical protein B0A56_00010 [Flavobacterium columnare NBRC 100251 = ATCC 23463]